MLPLLKQIIIFSAQSECVTTFMHHYKFSQMADVINKRQFSPITFGENTQFANGPLEGTL